MYIARNDRMVPALGIGLLASIALLGLVINAVRLAPVGGARNAAAPLQAAAQQRRLTKLEDVIAALQDRLRQAPNDIDAYAQLGQAYVQRARETADPTYYAKADSVFTAALKRNPQHLEALIGKGTLALARHQFRDALTLGEQARALDPTIPRIYGVIADAQIELGMYDAAVQTIQTMVDMRPDLSSYSRVSYVRELHGDLDGAVEAMQAALQAGGPNQENTQWTRVQLGTLYFNRNDLARAEQEYRHALTLLPNYVPAVAGLARVAAARGQTDEAITLYTDAVQRMPIPEYIITLGDLYASKGDQQRAQQQYALVQAIDKLFVANGVNTDLETALFFADHDINLPASLTKARAAYAARPSIQGADALAWTLYKTGNYTEAQRFAQEALKLGSRDSLKLFHAGMIALALGQKETARNYLQQALDLNPQFSLRWSDLAARTLQQLKGAK